MDAATFYDRVTSGALTGDQLLRVAASVWSQDHRAMDKLGVSFWLDDIFPLFPRPFPEHHTATVYRGVRSGSYVYSPSWTDDVALARRYSKIERLPGFPSRGHVVRAEIPGSMIIARIRRELIVDPDELEDAAVPFDVL